MTKKIKTTAPVSSVGADGAQPQLKNHTEIIANETAQINLQAVQNPEKSGSGRLQTVSMTELYDTVYPPRTPIVDGFLYGGTYLFVGAPKVGKSFLWGSLPTMWQWGSLYGIIPSEKGRCCIWRWKTITQGFSGGSPSCLVWNVRIICILRHRQKP